MFVLYTALSLAFGRLAVSELTSGELNFEDLELAAPEGPGVASGEATHPELLNNNPPWWQNKCYWGNGMYDSDSSNLELWLKLEWYQNGQDPTGQRAQGAMSLRFKAAQKSWQCDSVPFNINRNNLYSIVTNERKPDGRSNYNYPVDKCMINMMTEQNNEFGLTWNYFQAQQSYAQNNLQFMGQGGTQVNTYMWPVPCTKFPAKTPSSAKKLDAFWTKADCCICLAGCAEQGRSTDCDSWCSNCQC